MKFEDLNFMSIGSNCVFVATYPKDERLKGPVDNTSLKSVNAVKMLFDNSFYSFIKNTTPVKRPKKPNEFRPGDCEYETIYPNDTVSFVHNIPEGEKFFTEFKKRCDRLYSFIKDVRVKNNCWLVFALNGNFVRYGTEELVKHNLEDVIIYLKSQNILNKVIFLGSKVVNNNYKVHNHFLDAKSLELLKHKYNIKYVELINVSTWNPENAQKEFKLKMEKCLCQN